MSYEDDLYGLLKNAGTPELENNEDDSVKGIIEVYEETSKQEEQDGKNDPVQFSQAAKEECSKCQPEMLNRLFDQLRSPDMKLMRDNFEHVSKGDFVTSSVQLGKKVASAPPPTLLDQVSKVMGRY